VKLLQEHEIDLNKKYVIHTTGRYELYYGYKKSYWQSSTKNVKSLIKELKAKGEEQIG